MWLRRAFAAAILACASIAAAPTASAITIPPTLEFPDLETTGVDLDYDATERRFRVMSPAPSPVINTFRTEGSTQQIANQSFAIDVDINVATGEARSNNLSGGQGLRVSGEIVGGGGVGTQVLLQGQLVGVDATRSGGAFTGEIQLLWNVTGGVLAQFYPLDLAITVLDDTGIPNVSAFSRQAGFFVDFAAMGIDGATVGVFPLPGALPMLLTALGALGVLGYRRARAQA